MKTKLYHHGQLIEADLTEEQWEQAWRNWVRLMCRMREQPSREELDYVQRIHEGRE